MMDIDGPPDFGALIRRARRHAGLTQEALAERAGLSGRTISDLERGVVRAPRRDTLELLADALELTADGREHWERERQRLARRTGQPAGGTSGLIAAASRPSTLPVSLTRLIGRKQEVGDILTLLGRHETRLVTLTGTGGVGKTRLALAVAEAAQERYPAGVSFVSLAAVDDPALLLPTIASTLGLRDAPGQPPLAALTAYLRGERLLLVLDNFEQIVEAAPSVSDLLLACPDLTVLVTSRAPLHLQGEQLYRVPPLNAPEAGQQFDIEQLGNLDAVALFTERAQAINPEFRLTSENAAAVIETCHRLDGLPLALELAAARIGVLSPKLLLQRIERRLPLLTGGPRDAPEHQRTLQNTIAWSYDLLTAKQQALFQRLSVFRNGWTLEAAAAVADTVSRAENDLAVLDGLSALVEHNLITQSEQADGDVRFGMLATIREFAQEALSQSGVESSARQLHAWYYSRLVEQASAQFDGPRENDSIDLLEREHDNLRAAINWLRDTGNIEAGMNLTGMLQPYWGIRGFYVEGSAQIASLLRLADAEARTVGRARALMAATWLNLWQGDTGEAVDMSQEALAIWKELDDRDRFPHAYVTLGIAHAWQGDYEQAAAIMKLVVIHAREVGDFGNLSRALSNLGVMAKRQLLDDDALALYQESIAAARAGGSPNNLALVLWNLGGLHLEQGDYAQAERMSREALELWRASGSQWGIIGSLESHAEIALAREMAVRAARLAAAAGALRERISVPVQPIEQADYDRFIEDLRAALGDRFESVWAAGAALTVDEAVAEALESGTNATAPGQTG